MSWFRKTEASMGQGRTYQVLPVGAVDINAALIGIDACALVDLLFQTLEPQDAREY